MTQESGPDEMWFAGASAREVISYADLRKEPYALDSGGLWCVLAEFDGPIHAWRMKPVPNSDMPHVTAPENSAAQAPQVENARHLAWQSDQTAEQYQENVREVQRAIIEGEIYQANICRMLTLDLARSELPSPYWLLNQIQRHNPAPYAGLVNIEPTSHYPGAWVVSASPELSFAVDDTKITSAPIKGTAPTESELLEKDRTENVMITDVVRNDLAQICVAGSVRVEKLLELQHHPGLVHLVSTVTGELDWEKVNWSKVFAALHPPASVAGAPKAAAISLIAHLESSPRELYCGQLGWIDVDRRRAELAVGIRTFFYSHGQLRYGAGAGITADSDPLGEWNETILKSKRLISLISGKLEA